MIKWLTVLLLLFSSSALQAAHAASDSGTCMTCHGAMQGSVEKGKDVFVDLRIDSEKFSKSVHGGFECTECHKGFTQQPHKAPSAAVDKTVAALAEAISSKSKVDPVAQAACVQCHDEIYKAYKASVHGQNVIAKKSSDGPVCTSCHGSAHYIQSKDSGESLVNHFNTVKACGACHEEKGLSEKYKFTPHVMERYKESFHGRKLQLGHAGAPSCASCHGSHNVRNASDPASPVAGANKIKTCSKCHSGATPKFVAAITHKPMHVISHYTEIGLIILTVSVFVFIFVHVFLNIYAEIRDRLIGKGGSHD